MQQSHGLTRLLTHAIIHHQPKTDPRCSAVSLRQLSYLFDVNGMLSRPRTRFNCIVLMTVRSYVLLKVDQLKKEKKRPSSDSRGATIDDPERPNGVQLRAAVRLTCQRISLFYYAGASSPSAECVGGIKRCCNPSVRLSVRLMSL